ncbi:hypothetical protein ABS767_05250 [Sphingomonas sp. ST-64]|uniref:Cell wall polymerase n=1 Tax=Sphingomonas plantiphila TaxID=3163295 RepID=A0ABW8YKZ0_9SPHN
MSTAIRRHLTDLACRALQATLPPSLQSWGWAIRCEAASIPDDGKALLFALDGLCGLVPRAIALRLRQRFARSADSRAPRPEGTITVTIRDTLMHRPRALGVACAIGAVLLGLVYMALAGAPTRYFGMNVGALALGLMVLAGFGRALAPGQGRWDGAIVAMAGALLATALFGPDIDGVSRWVSVAGLSIQPSLILLPVMIVAFAHSRSAMSTRGLVVAAAAMALQPDRAMAGMLVLGLLPLVLTGRDRHGMVAFAASVIGLAATLARPDPMPAVPYVDRIYYSAFDVHVGAGLAVWIGSALLLVPALTGWHRDTEHRATYAAFGASWAAAILAAALGNHPTPLVGYGGSAIIGYALALLALPRVAGDPASGDARIRDDGDTALHDRHLRVGLA